MDERKLCMSCGADLTQKRRHKNRHGEYVCPTCRKMKQNSSVARSIEATRNRLALVAFCVAISVASCWIFWKALTFLNSPEV